jgi:hypothetical protein
MFDKNILFGFAAGVVVGALGLKFYNENRDTIQAKLKDINIPGFAAANEATANAQESSEDLTLEELMAQKERLDDLIAEYNAKKEAE